MTNQYEQWLQEEEANLVNMYKLVTRNLQLNLSFEDFCIYIYKTATQPL